MKEAVIYFILIIVLCTILTINQFHIKNDSILSYYNYYRLGCSYENNFRYDSAKIYYKNALRNIAEDSINLKYDIYVRLARIYNSQNLNDSASISLDTLKNIIHRQIDDTLYKWTEIKEIEASIHLDNYQLIESHNLLNKIKSIRIDLLNEEDTLLASVYNKLGNYFYFANNSDSAKYYYEKAITVSLKKSIKINKETSAYYQNLGLVYIKKSKFISALNLIKTSLVYKLRILPPNDISLINSYINIGGVYIYLNEVDSALLYFNLAEKSILSNEKNSDRSLASVYYSKGNGFLKLSEYKLALEHYYKAVSIYNKYSNLSPRFSYPIYNNIGYVYEALGDFDRAVEYYIKSIDSVNFSPSNIKSYRNLAKVYDTLQKNDLAREYYLLAIKESNKHFGEESFEMALSFRYYGSFLEREQNYEDSYHYLFRSLEIMKNIFPAKHIEICSSYTRIGILFQKLKDYDNALKYFQLGIIAACRDFENPDPLSNPKLLNGSSDVLFADALGGKSLALLEKYNTDPDKIEYLHCCRETCDLTIKNFRDISQRMSANESQQNIYIDLHRLYSIGIKVNYLLYTRTADPSYIVNAFNYAESDKANSLLQHLIEFEFKKIWNVSEELLTKEKEIKTRLDAHRNLIESEKLKQNPDLEAIQNWEEVIFETRQRFDSLMLFVKEKYPEYYKIKYSRTTIPMEELKAGLDADYALIEYFRSDTALFSFLVTNDTLLIHKTTIPEHFESDIQQILRISNPLNLFFFDSITQASYINALSGLYTILLKPYEVFINNRNLIIIPDQEISNIPFEILVTDAPTFPLQGLKSLSYVIREHACNYAPSATILYFQQHQIPGKDDVNVLAIAPETTGESGKGYVPSKQDDRKDLHGSKDEVDEISRYFNCTTLKGKRATIANVLQSASDYSILHFALHTQIDSDNPLNSKLLFYPQKDSSGVDELYAYEIYNLSLAGDLAVLSSCNTAKGKHKNGDGIMNLARAFQYAGIPSIVATLWSVEDKTTSQLMKYYYKNLHEGKNKDIALQQAKLNYLDNSSGIYSHPYFWSGFISIGNNDKLPPGRPGILPPDSILIGILIFLSMIMMIFIYRYIFVKKKR